MVMADKEQPVGGEDSAGGDRGVMVACDEIPVIGKHPPGSLCEGEASGTCEVW